MERLRTLLWPRRSFFRSARYFAKRVLRLSATPHAIAAGVAAGVFASFTPFIGFHFVIAAVVAWLLAGNLLASAIGTAVGNPLSFPFIWAATYQTGRLILDGALSHADKAIQLGRMVSKMEFALLWDPLLKPMAIGAIPLGIIFAAAAYAATRWATIAFQEQRRKRLAASARRRAARKARGLMRVDGAAANP